MKVLFFLYANKCINFFFNKKITIKFLFFSKLFFDYIYILNDFIILKIIKVKKRTVHIKSINKNKLSKFIVKFEKNDFIKLFLFTLIKIFIKIVKIAFNFLGFIIYAIWSYLNTILLYAIGYILLEFGATRIYDPTQDITSREIWIIISNKLYILKKKYFSKKYISIYFNIFYKRFIEIILTFYKNVFFLCIFIYYKLFFINKNMILNLYIYIMSFILSLILYNILFLNKIIYLKNFKKNLNFLFYNFKMYVFLNYLKIFINLFKKKKLFFLNKNLFEKKKLLNLIKFEIYTFNFKSYLRVKNKLKYKMLYIKNIFKLNRFKNYFSYRLKFWSTQKRFLYFYIKLLKKSKKIKMGALRVVYIEEWWVYKFYLKNYYFNLFLKIIFIMYNLIKNKIVFLFLYLNFIINLINF